MNKKLIAIFREKIKQRLQAKTSWGRNDLMIEIEAALADSAAELLDSDV
jgi:hypothetical protein